MWVDAAAWRQYHGFVHWLFTLPCVTIFNVLADVMHTVDIGVTQHLVGNVLFELCYDPRYLPAYNTPAARLQEVWRRVRIAID